MKSTTSNLQFPGPESFSRRFLVWGMPRFHAYVKLASHCLVPRWSASGRHHIPVRGPVIFAPNHISDVDAPLVGLCVRQPLWYMAKRELWQQRALVPLMNFFQAFPVDPASPDRTALRRSEELLSQGAYLVVFPEGQLSQSRELGPLLPGAMRLALRSGAPVIPVGIAGAEHVMPYGTMVPRFTWERVHVHFGPPVYFDDLRKMPPREAREQATQRLSAAMQRALEVARTKKDAA